MATARQIIDHLGLQPHPEGGWYGETWRAAASDGERANSTAIHFLLEAGQRSHWHTVDAAELWFWHAGDPLLLERAAGDAGPVETLHLGPDLLAGDQVQGVIPPGNWQAARSIENGVHGWTLVSCVVAPGFEFSGFVLAPEGWAPGA